MSSNIKNYGENERNSKRNKLTETDHDDKQNGKESQ